MEHKLKSHLEAAAKIVGLHISGYYKYIDTGTPASIIDIDSYGRPYVSICMCNYIGGLLRFESREKAEEFLKNNLELVYKYLMLNN